jgi:hypothetical protein
MDGSGPRVTDPLDLKALFEKFEVPWDDKESTEVFARTLAKLEDHERWRRWRPPDRSR